MSYRDLRGNKYGLLAAIEFVPGEGSRRGKWLCKCDCGNTKEVRPDALLSGATKSCGCTTYASENRRKDLSGKTFGRLTVMHYTHSDSHRVPHYLCKCECGTEKIISSQSLKRGLTVSCGCYHRERHHVHGITGHPLLDVYRHMKDRCSDPTYHAYKDYGGRGITVCDEWMNDAKAFYDWAVSNGYKEGLTLDRVDNNGNYEPSNCRWATRTEQGNNKRNNIVLEFNGKAMTLHDWARALNINPGTLDSRLRNGWSIEKALTCGIIDPKTRKPKSALIPVD